ncbi:MAG: chalcone isomerase [Monoraphidium minutum]|nr:MAG: chalcone isomerase [Monoraphidium minutum]
MDGRKRGAALVSGGAIPWAQGAAAAAPAMPLASMTFGLPFLGAGLGGAGRRRGGGAPFASVGASCCSKAVPKLFAAPLTEPATGIAYPDTLCVATKSHCPGLAGVGVRAKRILGLKNINVYALGLYVDASGAKKALGKWKGSSGDALLKSQAAFDALVNTESFERSLRLVISFGGLKRATFVNALEERLAPPLRKAGKSAVMQDFERLFDNASFKKGTEIDFSASGHGKLVTKVDGKQVGTIESPELVKALFDIYLGSDAVSADAKASFAQGLSALLRE